MPTSGNWIGAAAGDMRRRTGAALEAMAPRRSAPPRWSAAPGSTSSSASAACPQSADRLLPRRRAEPPARRRDHPARRTENGRHRHADLLHQRHQSSRTSAAGRSSSRCCAARSEAEMKRGALLIAALAALRRWRCRRRRRRAARRAPRAPRRPPAARLDPDRRRARPKAAFAWAIPMRAVKLVEYLLADLPALRRIRA